MLKESMVEVAYSLMLKSEGPQSFSSLYNQLSEVLEMNEEEKEDNISKFYTKLILDERFVLLEDNHWDLRERESFEKVHIDMNDVYSEIEEEEKEMEEEKKEESFYDDEEVEHNSDEDEEEPKRHKDEEEDEEEEY